MQNVIIIRDLLRIPENYNNSYNLGIKIANVSSKDRLHFKINTMWLILFASFWFLVWSWNI